MSDQHLSIADRWMQRYEQEHPEVLQQTVRSPCTHQNNCSRPTGSTTPSRQSKTGGNTRLWNTVTCAPETPIQPPLDPVVLEAIQARKALKLTQAKFARCLGISPRTVSEWEQGRRQPSGAARTLLHWAAAHPDYLKGALKSLSVQ